MADLAKAELRELDADLRPVNEEKWTTVQFNPDTLKVTYANQVQTPSGTGDQRGPQAQQFVGSGSTKLAVQLYFDVTQDVGQGLADVASATDVRKLTERVAYFITPVGNPPNQPTEYKIPLTRFVWGSFQFDGVVEAMEETLELFSFEGRPLRALVTMTLSQQRITAFAFNAAAEPPGVARRNRPAPGTQPQTPAPQGLSLQLMASVQPGGAGGDWQSVALANGIENPRILAPGQLIDFRAKPPIRIE